ncbi:cell cycle associated protein, putative [Plasmodium gallinaceum]|uniref:Cell cycle associated protein, putative n=1 Tax=Plasmodium gallinaceum TaxID=5849 RepID=A0A1J1GZQ5_PLAGA|nr:cell cycle associated protein, putative [Plasmodium gallinaceum]CRG97767.1 cell cycle associated protein, putative [Plasmodium gallinaceum]
MKNISIDNRKLEFFNLENKITGKTNDYNNNSNAIINCFNINRTNEKVYYKSKKNNKLCVLKDLNFNGDYLVKKKRKEKKLIIKNNELNLRNKYDYFLKKKCDIFNLQSFNTRSHNLSNIHDIYYIYKDGSDISDIIIKRYNENIYVSIFNNILLLINPSEHINIFYKLLFKSKNKNNYIFYSFINNALKKNLGEVEFDYISDLEEESESSEEIKKVINYINRKSDKNKICGHNFKELKKQKKKKKNLIDIKKDLINNNNNEIKELHKDILSKIRINFNLVFNINNSRNKEIVTNNNSKKLINSTSFSNIYIAKNSTFNSFNFENKLLFIYGEKYSNQNIINKYIFKHIIKTENSEVYHNYKKVMSIINLFFNSKCYNYIIHYCNENKILYFNFAPFFLYDQNNVTNICKKITDFYEELISVNIENEEKSSNESIKNNIENFNHFNTSTDNLRYQNIKNYYKIMENSNYKDNINNKPELNKKSKYSDNNSNKNDFISIPFIFFFLLQSILIDNSNKNLKVLKLHPLDIKKIYKNYIESPCIDLKTSDIERIFSNFLELGFTEQDIISINKIIFAIIFINVYINIRRCLKINEERTLNCLKIQLIKIEDFMKLRKWEITEKKSNEDIFAHNDSNNSSFLLRKKSEELQENNFNNLFNFNIDNYLSSGLSSFSDVDEINVINNIIKSKYTKEESANESRNKYNENSSGRKSEDSKLNIKRYNTRESSENNENLSGNDTFESNKSSFDKREKKYNYFIVFAGHILEEYISFLLDVDLNIFVNILNDTIKLKNLCTNIFFRLKIKIIQQVNEFLKNTSRNVITKYSLFIYCNNGLVENLVENNKGNKKNNLNELINNIYDEVLHSYYVKMSLFNLDSSIIHTLNELDKKNANCEDAIFRGIQKFRNINNSIYKDDAKNSINFHFDKIFFGKNKILHLLEKFTYKYLSIIDYQNSYNESKKSQSLLIKTEYYKIMHIFYLTIKELTHYYNEIYVRKNKNCFLEQKVVENDDESYIEKKINELIDSIIKTKKQNNYKSKIYKKKKFTILHYNGKKTTYKCDNMLLDNIRDIYTMNDIIQIIENSHMKFLKNIFFKDTIPLKGFKSNYLYDEICFFINTVTNTYEKFYILVLNEKEKKNQDFFLPKYISNFVKHNESLTLDNEGISSLRSNIFKNNFSLSLNRLLSNNMKLNKKKISNVNYNPVESIMNFSEFNKKISKHHITSVVNKLYLNDIFNYQSKYLYYNLTYLSFIKKYILFCIHFSKDEDLIKLLNYYELKHKKDYNKENEYSNTYSGISKKSLINDEYIYEKNKTIQNNIRMDSSENKFNYLNNLSIHELEDLCKIILYNFNISENTFYFQRYIFIRKYVYFILENLKNEYLKSVVPLIRRIENSYISYKYKKSKLLYRHKIKIIQNYMQKFLFFYNYNKIQKQKNLLVSFLIFYSFIVRNKYFGETKETLELSRENFINKEKQLIRHASCLYIQAWFRKIIQQRKYKELKLELAQRKAIENISVVVKTYITQLKMVKNINEVIIPNRCATLIQSYFKKYMCLVNFQKKLFLKICFLSIKRKYMMYSNVITKMNYHYLLKNIYNRSIIKKQFKIPEAVVKIQSKYKSYVVKKQYNLLINAIYFTQAYIHTSLEAIRYNKIKKSIYKIQIWWKNFIKLKKVFSAFHLNIYSSAYEKKKYYFLQKSNFPNYYYYILKEQKALKLLTYNILLKQWYFFYFKKLQKKNHLFNIVFNLKLYKNISYYYMLPWAYKINSILKIIHMKHMFQESTNSNLKTLFNIPVFESVQIFVGKTHTILLINQKMSSEEFTYNEDKNSRHYYSKFVYSCGSNDYGQLGYYNLYEKNSMYYMNSFPKGFDNDTNEKERRIIIITEENIQNKKKSFEEKIKKDNKKFQINDQTETKTKKNYYDINDSHSNKRSSSSDGKKSFSLNSSIDKYFSKDNNSYNYELNKKKKKDVKNKKKFYDRRLKNLQHLIFQYEQKYTISKRYITQTYSEFLNDISDYKIIQKKNKNGEIEKVIQFTKVINETNKINYISCGSEHTLALSENGNVYSWGSNAFGQCGQKYEKAIIRYPKIIKHFLKNKILIKYINCASYHSGYISSTNDLYISGNFFFINLKYFNSNIYEPTFLISGCLTILCKDSFNISLRTNKNSLYIWGNNYKCILGLNKKKLVNLDEISVYPLTKIFVNIYVKKITCSDNFVCIITKINAKKYSLFMWGQFSLIEKKESNSLNVATNTNIFNKFKIKTNIENRKNEKKNGNDEQNNIIDNINLKKKKIFIASPTPVYNDLWENIEAIDICCDLDEILVLMSNLCLYGFNSVEVLNKEIKKNEEKDMTFYNPFKKNEKEEKKEKKLIYEEPEIYDNINFLNPSLYMFKYFKPSYFNIKKINCSYNKNSLSIMNATMGEYELPKFNENIEYITPSGDIVKFPEKIKEAILKRAENESNKWIRSKDDPYINHFLIKNTSDSED